jgi:hypothetical protein
LAIAYRSGAVRSSDVSLETFFARWKRGEVAPRLSISVKTHDNHLRARFRSLRQLLTQEGDVITKADRSPWYDHIEEQRERCAATRPRPASGKTHERSTSQDERCNSEGERSNSEGKRSNTAGKRSTYARERGKSCGVDSESAVSPGKS